MAAVYERYFIVCGYRITISPEFDQYNATRSKQERQIDAIVRRYTEDLLTQLQSDLNRLIGSALDSFRCVVSDRIKTTIDVATIGFPELQKHQNEVLARIGKRMIFKYTSNEYISVSEVAQHLTIDPQKYFAGFLEEVKRLEKGQQNYQIQQAYDRINQSQPSIVGIGFGTKGAMELAAGNIAVNAGISVMQRIGVLISNAIQASVDSENSKKVFEHGIKALYEAYQGLSNQLSHYICEYIGSMMDAEVNKVGVKPFCNIPEEQEKAVAVKRENYQNAFRHGDITNDKYVAFLISTIEEVPHRLTVYYDLFQVVHDTGNAEAQKSILVFTDYLGFDGQMERWMKKNRITPPTRTKEDIAKFAGIICSDCGKENKANAKFCKGCGRPLGETIICPACGNHIRPGKKFCSKCGMQIC